MSLRHDYYSYNGSVYVPSTIQFSTVERRLTEKKTELEDMQNEYDLLERQAFETYKNNIDYFFYSDGTIDAVKKWLSMQKTSLDSEGKNLDGRKNYPEQETVKFFIDMLKEHLGVDDIEIESVIDYNFGQAHEIEFLSHGRRWLLSIPRVKTMSLKSYHNYGAGVFKLRLLIYDTKYSSRVVGTTYEEDELKFIMERAIEAHCKGENNE